MSRTPKQNKKIINKKKKREQTGVVLDAEMSFKDDDAIVVPTSGRERVKTRAQVMPLSNVFLTGTKTNSDACDHGAQFIQTVHSRSAGNELKCRHRCVGLYHCNAVTRRGRFEHASNVRKNGRIKINLISNPDCWHLE